MFIDLARRGLLIAYIQIRMKIIYKDVHLNIQLEILHFHRNNFHRMQLKVLFVSNIHILYFL